MPTLDQLLASLSETDDVAYVLGPDRTILASNAGWSRFARDNGADGSLGRWERGDATFDDAVPEPLRAFYRDAFARALATGERWEHEYECSSDVTWRRYRMVVYPVDGRLVVVNSLVAEAPHQRPECASNEAVYVSRGLIVMCSHCRRVRNPTGALRWDWVPAYVRSPPHNVSHGLCEPCEAFYWGDVVGEAP